MAENKKPAIRFKGFTDAWEQRELGEIATEIIAGGDVDKSLLCEEGNCPVIANALTNDGIIGYYKNEYRVKAPAVTVTGRGDVGHAKARNDDFTPVVRLLSVKSEHDIYFLENAINAIKIVVESTGVPQLTVPQLSKNVVFYPNSAEEEMKIGTYFRNLDTLITLHQRKYDKLVKVKKSMLEKMFPKNGSLYPEIRFAGFTDAWEQREFKSITFPSGVKNKENLPYESYSVTNENGFIPQNEQFENGGTMATADKTMYYIVTPNSFAYNPARINVGSIGYYKGSENVIVSSLYEVFQTTDEIDDRFLWHWFKSEKFQRMIEQYQEGGVRLYFYYDKLCMCSISTPNIEEQRKIGAYFDHLDNLITLHQRKLEKLKNIKKSMLQKMFL